MTSIAAPLSDLGSGGAVSAAVATLLFLPGLAWNAVAGPSGRVRLAFTILPGLLLLCTVGLMVWVLQPHNRHFTFLAVMVPEAIAAFVLAARLSCGVGLRALLGRDGGAVLAIWAAVVVSALSTGLNPLPMAMEDGPGSLIPGRMVTSPPDDLIPYLTAVYFDHGFDGRQRSLDYFGADWSVVSRGPLVPTAMVALFRVFDARPGDMPDLSEASPTRARQGTALARILGWLTNGLVVMGLAHLLTTLNVGPGRRRLGLAWAALSPLVMINTVFLWPKLLAGFFVLLATASVLEASWALAGACLALGWLSHPVAILFLPGIGLLVSWQAARRSRALIVPTTTRFALAFIVVAAPWLAYRAWLGTHDIFVDYLLSDGDVPNRAKSLGSWLALRWDNVVYTLVPGSFFASGMVETWGDAPVSTPLRWTIQYAKTLPGELGFAMVLPTYGVLLLPLRDPALRALRLLCLGTFVLMVIVWGYSSDGLGRNCLEPLVPAIIVVASAGLPPWRWLALAGLAGLWLEGRWVDVASFATTDGFRWMDVPAASWTCWIVGGAISLAVVVWGWGVDPPRTGRLIAKEAI